MRRRVTRFQRGVTLIELVVSIVIVSVATIGLMTVVTAAVGRSADPMIESQATAIAQGYLDEIAQVGFCDPDFDPDGDPATGCPEECTASPCQTGCGGRAFAAESGRAEYDDVCDYAGLADDGARDRLDNGLAGLLDYRVDVTVRDSGVRLGDPALSADSGEVVRVEITVRHPALAVPYTVSTYQANLP